MRFEPQEEVGGGSNVLRALQSRGDEVVLIQGERTITAAEALRLIYQIAHVLADHGVGVGTPVAMLSMNLPETYLAACAVSLLGARYTPLHPLGSLSDHQFVLDDAEIEVIVYDPRLYTKRAGELRGAAGVRHVFALGADGTSPDLIELAAAAPSDPLPPPDVRGGDIAAIIYTGGTTGTPKGVAHTWFGRWYTEVVGIGNATMDSTEQPPCMLINSPISHAGGAMISPAIIRGGRVVLVDKFDPPAWVRLIERWQVTSVFLVPTMIYKLLDYLNESGDTSDLSSINRIVYGASPMSPTRLAEGLKRFGPVFAQGYGQTEAGVGILQLHRSEHRLDRPDILASAGRPTLGVVVKVLREDGTEASPGEIGELCIRGPVVMKEYWKRPDLTEHALRGGWLHTDDMGFASDEGYITLVDRRKDMIISGGFNVYPSEVENAVSELPAVASCAVIGVPDDQWGEAVTAFVVLKKGTTLTADDVIAHVRERKGPVNTPKTVTFVESLPVTAVGKLDKKALRQSLWNAGDRQIH